jgi:hypothetical protein
VAGLPDTLASAIDAKSARTVRSADPLAVPPAPVQDREYTKLPDVVRVTLWLPLTGSDPLHAPLAAHAVAFVDDQVSVVLEPAVMEVGLIERLTVGAGAVVVKGRAWDVPPPGAGLTTVTLSVPAAAMSAAVIAAVSWVEDTNVVARLAPFHCTVEFETKLDPLTVRVKDGPPWRADAGDNEEIAGAGLLTANDAAADIPPPGVGLTTVILAFPAAEIFVAVTAAVSCVADTNVVARLEPFHCTFELEMKLVPFAVKVRAAPPVIADDGESELIDGTGLDGGAELDPDEPPPHPTMPIPMKNGISSTPNALAILNPLWGLRDRRLPAPTPRFVVGALNWPDSISSHPWRSLQAGFSLRVCITCLITCSRGSGIGL